MPQILLYNIAPDDENFIRDAMAGDAAAIHTLHTTDLAILDAKQEYCLIFARPEFEDKAAMEQLFNLRNRTDRCMTIFVLPEASQELIRASYLVGDGSIVFPMDADKFRRIIHWYVSTGETRHMEVLKEKTRRRHSTVLAKLYANKGLIFTLILATLLLGAFVGFFCADLSDGGRKTGMAPLDKIIGVFYELHK